MVLFIGRRLDPLHSYGIAYDVCVCDIAQGGVSKGS